MSYQVTVQPSGRQFTAEPGETLLDAALRQGLTLPHGCKDGACGACKGKVAEGQVEHGKAMAHALTADEKAAGLALFCCATARSDVTIEARQLRSAQDFPVKTLPARIEALTRLAPDVIELHLRLPATERMGFHAGQYVDILLKDGRKRSFSLAHAPQDGGFLQLHVRHVPGGAFTDPLFSTMKVKDILRLNGPHGSFTLQGDSTRPMLLVAGGTGFAPIKSIVEQAIATQSTRPMTLYWGARDRAGLYMADLPARWATVHPHICYVPVLSEPDADWAGRTGLVHAAAMADYPDLSAHQVYVCGAPAMVEAARTDFVGRCGLPDTEFFADAFSYAAD